MKNQINFYTNLLKDGEILLLKSKDEYFKNHYTLSPLNLLTNFQGSAGEAIIEKSGKITLFVDTRYHLLAPKQVFSNIEIYKMSLGETFFEAFEKKYKKGTILHLPSDISFCDYMKLDRHFDLRKYKLKKSFLKNGDFNKNAPVFLVDKDIEKLAFEDKFKKIKKSYLNISKMLVFNLDEISYLTNLRSFQTKYSSNFRSILYLDFKSENNILFLDKIPKKIKINKLNFQKLDSFCDFIKSIDDEIYIDTKTISLEKFLAVNKPKENKKNNLSFIASAKPISAIEHLKDLFRRLDCALFEFKNKLKAGLSEVELAEIFEDEMLNQKIKCPSFKTILALDENSASIHYSSYDKNKFLKNESLVLIDCGGYSDFGYASDITRTFYFGSKPKEIYKRIYTKVLKAFISCFLSKETNASKLDKLAREILFDEEKEGFYFNHGLGHGIGTSVHQNPPCLSIFSKDIIKPYQVHSIEPGLYGKSEKTGDEFGVRIENCVFYDINYKRFSLSNFPFEEVLIDYSILSNEEKDFVFEWNKKVKF